MIDLLLNFMPPDRMDGTPIYQDEISYWECVVKVPDMWEATNPFRCNNPQPFKVQDMTLCWKWRPIMKDGVNGKFSNWVCFYSIV